MRCCTGASIAYGGVANSEISGNFLEHGDIYVALQSGSTASELTIADNELHFGSIGLGGLEHTITGRAVVTGTYTISATLSPSGVLGNYSILYNTANFSITPAVLTMSADNKTITEGNPLPTFTASYNGFQYGDNQGVLSGNPSLTTNAPQNPPVGTYTIYAAQGTLSAQNYTFSFVNGTLTVVPAVAQITTPAKNSTLTSTTGGRCRIRRRTPPRPRSRLPHHPRTQP
jgi:hypothetical protein